MRRLQGEVDAAASLSRRALEATASLMAKDRDNPGWQRRRADALVEHARQALAAGDPGPAETELRQAMGLLEPLLAKQPEDRALLLAAVPGQLELAALETPDAATARLRRALAACDAQAGGQHDPRLRALRAELLLRLGRQAEGEALAKSLWGDGYRDAAFAVLLKRHAITPAPPSTGLAGGSP